ncbi:syntaxin-binding protein 5 isoform X3 [Chironomus tepperi]
MKKFTFKGVLDGFRSSVQSTQQRCDKEIEETLRPNDFTLKKTFRHGFPHNPTAIAFDPVQKLLAIGDKYGSLRILGQPGVDAHVRHEGESACAVIQIEFLVNEGALVTVTADDTLHYWNFQKKIPTVVHCLKFQRESITFIHLPVGSKWLYVGTEKGNIHIVHTESFTLSGYIIHWNKAVELTMKTHPGSVVHLSDNPLDSNKVLIGYELGLITLWDMKGKFAEFRWQSHEPLRSISWHYEGKSFVSSHIDGSLCTWPLRATAKPHIHIYPHAKPTKEGKLETCKPIHKVELKTTRNGETFTIFSGGLSMEKGGKSPCITVLQGKGTTVLHMEHPVVGFVTMCESPWMSDMQEPYAIAVLLQNDLVIIDLTSNGFPCFDSPYSMDLHDSPVTCCTYLADCPSDLVPAFYSVGRHAQSRKPGTSEKHWPVSGGSWAPASRSYSEIIITGHQDGSVKFWDAGSGSLLILYKLKTAKIFDKPKTRSLDGSADEDPLAIQVISLCPESRRLCVAGYSGHVILFKFKKQECLSDILVLEIPITYENTDETDVSPECEFIPRSLPKQPDSMENEKKCDGMLRVRPGQQRKPPGFQAQLVCLTPWTNNTHPGQITSLCINSSYGLMAYGNESGLVIVDIVQKVYLINVASPDLYGAQDPYSRTPRSPKRSEPPYSRDEQRSPSIDQLNDMSISPQAKSNEPSRPASPATDALEVISLDDEALSPSEEAQRMKSNLARKTSSWKGFKSLTTKAELKLKSTFVDSFSKDRKAVDGTMISPTEISPDSVESGPSSPDDEESENMADLIKNIEELGAECDKEMAATNVALSNVTTPTTSMKMSNNGDKKDKRVDFVEEPYRKISFPVVEGAGISRPTDLTFSKDPNSPVAPPRVKKEKRLERLLSVPNIKLNKQDQNRLISLRKSSNVLEQKSASSSTTTTTSTTKNKGNFMRRFSRADKLDNSFSRSRSSSMSSLENISSESVTCLAFVDSYTKKSDPSALIPTLWLGTSLGSVLTVSITLPEADTRNTSPVLVSILGGPIFRLKGSILCMSFLDCNGALIPYSYEPWKDEGRQRDIKTPTKSSANRMSPTLNQDLAFGDRQFMVIVSEKQCRIVALPSQNCVYRLQITETDFVVRAEVVSMKDSVCLVCYLSNGHLMAFGLPSLRLLLDVDFLPLADLSFQTKCKQGIVDPMLSIWGQQLIVHEDSNQISKTFCFSNRGHGLYLATPTEIQKFTLCSEFSQNYNDMLGDLYLQCEMPEPPKESFFKGLFGGGARSIDREELFGEVSGKPNRSVAKLISGPNANIQDLNTRANTASNEFSRAHQLMIERGDKLNKLEDNAERMSNEAQQFSGAASQLMAKYRDKKWYQL